MRIKKKHATRIVSGALCAALVVSALSGCVASSSSTSAEANGVDGTYTATAAGFGGDVTVTVTVKMERSPMQRLKVHLKRPMWVVLRLSSSTRASWANWLALQPMQNFRLMAIPVQLSPALR